MQIPSLQSARQCSSRTWLQTLRGFPTPHRVPPLFCAFCVVFVLVPPIFHCSLVTLILCAPGTCSWLGFCFIACSLDGGLKCSFSSTYLHISALPLSSGCQSGFPDFAAPFAVFAEHCQVSLLRIKMGSACRPDSCPSRRLTGEANYHCVSILFCTVFCSKVISQCQRCTGSSNTRSLLNFPYAALISLLTSGAAVSLPSWCSAPALQFSPLLAGAMKCFFLLDWSIDLPYE